MDITWHNSPKTVPPSPKTGIYKWMFNVQNGISWLWSISHPPRWVIQASGMTTLAHFKCCVLRWFMLLFKQMSIFCYSNNGNFAVPKHDLSLQIQRAIAIRSPSSHTVPWLLLRPECPWAVGGVARNQNLATGPLAAGFTKPQRQKWWFVDAGFWTNVWNAQSWLGGSTMTCQSWLVHGMVAVCHPKVGFTSSQGKNPGPTILINLGDGLWHWIYHGLPWFITWEFLGFDPFLCRNKMCSMCQHHPMKAGRTSRMFTREPRRDAKDPILDHTNLGFVGSPHISQQNPMKGFGRFLNLTTHQQY